MMKSPKRWPIKNTWGIRWVDAKVPERFGSKMPRQVPRFWHPACRFVIWDFWTSPTMGSLIWVPRIWPRPSQGASKAEWLAQLHSRDPLRIRQTSSDINGSCNSFFSIPTILFSCAPALYVSLATELKKEKFIGSMILSRILLMYFYFRGRMGEAQQHFATS